MLPASRMMSGMKIDPWGPSRWIGPGGGAADLGLVVPEGPGEMRPDRLRRRVPGSPTPTAAASRTSTCSAPSSEVSRANAGWAAFPSFPSVWAAIVRIFGVGSSSSGVERRDGLGRGLAVALDELGGREADLRVAGCPASR